MPLYEYECTKCKFTFERLQRFSDAPPECPECGGVVSQLLSPPAIQFKGTGWYVTDYANRNTGPKPANGNGSSAGSKTESKTDAKTVSKSEPATTSSEKK